MLIEDTWYLNLRLAHQIVLAVLRYHIGYLLGILLSEDTAGETLQPRLLISWLNGIRIPSIVHDEVDRHFLWLQVTHVDNPDAVDATGVSLMQLFTEFRNGSGVHPTVVPRTTIHVDVVIKSQATLALTLFGGTLATDIAPVVVAEQEGYIVRHGEACVIITLYLGKDCPKLRHRIGRTTVCLFDDATLGGNHFSQGLDVLGIISIAHCRISIASHTDSYEVVVLTIALHTL